MKVTILVLASSVLITGCAGTDPYTRDGVWRPNGANDKNLRAMIANPNDLVTGAADGSADGQVMAAAVTRYRTGRVKELGEGSASKISPITVNNGSSPVPTQDGD